MNALIEYLKCCWKGVATIVGMLAIITALVAFYSNLATSADLKQAKDEAKLYTQQSVVEMKKTMSLDRAIIKLDNVNQRLMNTKLLLYSQPKNKELKEDYEALKADKIKLQQEIEKR